MEGVCVHAYGAVMMSACELWQGGAVWTCWHSVWGGHLDCCRQFKSLLPPVCPCLSSHAVSLCSSCFPPLTPVLLRPASLPCAPFHPTPLLPLQALLPVFDDPSSAKCMNAVTYAGNENWATFVDPGANQLLPHGHLLTYPTWADENGNVKALEGCEEFPDLGGKIMGTKSGVLPPVLTT